MGIIMIFNRKSIIVLLILVGTFAIVGGVCAQDYNDNTVVKSSNIVKEAKTTGLKTAIVKIHNFKPGVSWGPKAVKLGNGDAIAGYVEYKGNSQFTKGTGVTSWFIGNGLNGDLEPHHTKLVQAKFYFKNNAGKFKTKVVKGNGGSHIRTGLISGYTPYQAVVWYQAK